MRIKLLTTQSDDEIKLILMTAIRTCYSSNRPQDIYNGKTPDKEKYLGERANGAKNKHWVKLKNNILRCGHWSVLEHIRFTFAVSDVSRSMMAQTTRHRFPSFSIQSQRYVNMTKLDVVNWVMPNIDEEKEQWLWEYLEGVKEVYDKLIDEGWKAEDARAILPNAFPTNFVITVNLRSLIELLDTRGSVHAQKEIRTFVGALREGVSHLPTVKDLIDTVIDRTIEDDEQELKGAL